MTITKLCSLIAKTEGKKKQTSIGNVRELFAILSDLAYLNPEVLLLLLQNGKRRAKK